MPAILGHTPAFAEPVRFVKPDLPAYASMESALREIVSSGMLTKGVWLRRFEEAVAQHLGAKHAVAVSSCTTGLMLAYRGLDLTGDVVVPLAVTFKTLAIVKTPPRWLSAGSFTLRNSHPSTAGMP